MSLLKVFTKRLSKKNIIKAELSEHWRYGLSNANGIIAADRSQNLLAIGTNKGINLIRFPRNKNNPEEIRETYLYLAHDKTKINFLKFKTGGEYLISIFDNEELIIWNVNERNVHLQVKLSINVSSVDFYPDSNWLFLGSDNGCIYIYDVVNGILSNTNIICKTKSGESIPSLVQCLSVNPCKNRILIGFEYGLIIQYHIKKQKVIERYQQEEILTSIKWCPDGIHFITGSDQGSLFFWKTGKATKPLLKKKIKEYENSSSPTTPKNDDSNNTNQSKENLSLELIKPINKIEWISIDKNKTLIFCSEKSPIEVSENKITIISLQNVEFGSPLSVNSIKIDEKVNDFDIVPYENRPLLVTLGDNNCQFFNLEDRTEETFIYNSLTLLKLSEIIKAIQTQYTKDFITAFISEEKYEEYSENILFNGYVTYHKDHYLRYWLQTSYGFIFLESLQLPENIEIHDFLVSYDKTLIIYDNKFEIYSLIKNRKYDTIAVVEKNEPLENGKDGMLKLQRTKVFDSKIESFTYYKQMGIIALMTETKKLNIFSMYHDDQPYIIDATTLISNPVTVDLLESNVDFPIIVIGNEKGQCMNYIVVQTDKEYLLQPVQDSKFNVSSKILYIKSIPAMSINEIVENTISPLEMNNASIDGDDFKSSPTKSDRWNIKIKEKLYVVVTSNHIKVFKNKFSDLFDSIKLEYEPIFSSVIEIDGLKYCICISLNENLEIYMNFYSIPNLDLVRVTKFPTNDLASFETLSITPTGLMIVWFRGNEFKQYFVWGKEIPLEESDIKKSISNELISPYSAKSQSWNVDFDEELSYTIPKSRRTSIREIDTIFKKNLEINSPNKEITPINLDSPSSGKEEKIFSFKKIGLASKVLSKSDSHCDKVKKDKSITSIGSTGTNVKTTGNLFSQTRENIQERGERLDELGNQVNELNQGANEFLKTIREYNERMSKKKWYQL